MNLSVMTLRRQIVPVVSFRYYKLYDWNMSSGVCIYRDVCRDDVLKCRDAVLKCRDDVLKCRDAVLKCRDAVSENRDS